MTSSREIINQLNLQPHPEGGYFRETYRSSGNIHENSLGEEYAGPRNYSTCIYFLLTSESFSAFHRIKQDEIWHFYDGSPIRLHIISKEGVHTQHLIGRNLKHGEEPQLVVPGGCWFASEVVNENAYSLVGCTVAPGFSFEDFEMKGRKELISIYPHLVDVITMLTHS